MKIQNRYGFIEELTNLVVKNEFSKVKYDVDIYLYVRKTGKWRFFEFKNYTRSRCFDDDHLTVWTIKGGTDNGVFFQWIEEKTGEDIEEEERWDRMKDFYREYFDKYIEILFERQLGIFIEWI